MKHYIKDGNWLRYFYTNLWILGLLLLRLITLSSLSRVIISQNKKITWIKIFNWETRKKKKKKQGQIELGSRGVFQLSPSAATGLPPDTHAAKCVTTLHNIIPTGLWTDTNRVVCSRDSYLLYSWCNSKSKSRIWSGVNMRLDGRQLKSVFIIRVRCVQLSEEFICERQRHWYYLLSLLMSNANSTLLVVCCLLTQRASCVKWG